MIALLLMVAATVVGDSSPAPQDTLVTPPVLTNIAPGTGTVEVRLVAAPARLSLVPGATSDLYAYNGHVPGPTLEAREGDRVIVHFRNELPESTTVHWHGLHVPFASDGSPFHPVPPGGQRDYVFTVQRGTAGTYWYHPHQHHRTRDQVAKGLYGAIIIRAPNDPLADLPEKLLILADNRFLPGGSLDIPSSHSAHGRLDAENGREGDVLFVNGQIMPALNIRSGEVQRWRIVNASAARMYRLAIPTHRFLHVGSDGGLFERPVDTDEVLVASSERVELLVRGSGARGSQTALQTLPYDRYVPQTRPADWRLTRNLLTVRYANEPPVPVPIPLPATLRRIAPLDTADATTTRVMVLTQGFINGKVMDLARVDASTTLGATEIWQIENLVGMDHPFHLHGFRFQVLEVDGVPVPYRSWKDTVNVPKHGTVRFIVRFDDFPGKWMFHCHILDHEDHGMMGVFEVR